MTGKVKRRLGDLSGDDDLEGPPVSARSLSASMPRRALR